MTNIAQLKEQLSAKKKEIKDSRAEAKALQTEITKEIEKEHSRIKSLLSDILIKTAAKEEKVKEILLTSITKSKSCKDDIDALFQLINVTKEESDSETGEQSMPPAESGSETNKQVDRFAGQPRLTGERTNSSFSC